MVKNLSNRHLFLNYLGQTSKHPIALEIKKAKGIYLYTSKGKKYIDMVSGVCVNNFGHNHQKVVEAVVNQAKIHMHLMVYGEYIQQPQLQYAKTLVSLLPHNLESIYYVNSGSEAIEGAIKLAKRFTKRTEIIAFKNAYHGSTHGALSIGHENLKNTFRPLLPDVKLLEFNNRENILKVSKKTACVVVEPIQAEAGVILPEEDFLKDLSDRCKKTGTLFIFDEVQTGFGRCGTLFAFEQYEAAPDILVIAKAMGGGMPLGGFISSKNIMDSLAENPTAGHITTFGGHPVSCASAIAALNLLINTSILSKVKTKGDLIYNTLKNHPTVFQIRKTGLLLAVELKEKKLAAKAINALLEEGLVTDRFLFNDYAFRIAPPLTITKREIKTVCKKIIKALDALK